MADLQRRIGPGREQILAARAERWARLRAGERPDFLPETAGVRDGDWQVAPAPPALANRRVEITGPTEAKMLINAFNSGRQCLHGRLRGRQLADLGQPRRRAGQPQRGDRPHPRVHQPRRQGVPPRGPAGRAGGASPGLAPRRAHVWSMGSRSRPALRLRAVLLPQRPAPARQGAGPYFYLPKLEGHLEARLWNDIFNAAQDALGFAGGPSGPPSSSRRSSAAFEMEEILYELRDHAAGLNAGRWDYIFSIIKKFRTGARSCSPTVPDHDDGAVHAAYTELLVEPATAEAPMPSAGWPPSSPPAGTRRSTGSPWPR